MPQINLPDIVPTERVTAWLEGKFDWNGMLAIAQGEIVSEFELGTPEPAVDDVLTIFFHTFEAGRERQRFILTPRDGVLILDLCEMEEMGPLEEGPLAGQTLRIPVVPK